MINVLKQCTMYTVHASEQKYNKQCTNARKFNCGCTCILCAHIETSSLWAEFVNKNRCISVRLVSEEDKSI